MLSNKDFAALIASGADLTRSDQDNKVRFDLKQVKQWDKQNRLQDKKRTGVVQKKNVFGEADDGGNKLDKSILPPGYRDRALERRKNENKAAKDPNGSSIVAGDETREEQERLEALVQDMDIDQSKFLGGDVEHTHLVKGLDYVLLRKMREQLRKENQSAEEGEEDSDSDAESVKGDSSGEAELQITTDLGRKLHKLLFKPDTKPAQAEQESAPKEAYVRLDLPQKGSGLAAVGSRPGAGTVALPALSIFAPLSKPASLLQRTVYEMHIAEAEDALDVPLGVVRAPGKPSEQQEGDRSVLYAMPVHLHSQLAQICADGGGSLRPRSKRKHAQQQPGASASASSGANSSSSSSGGGGSSARPAELPANNAPAAAAAAAATPAAKALSIYDDDDLGGGAAASAKYDPLSVPSGPAQGAPLAGLFRSLQGPAGAAASAGKAAAAAGPQGALDRLVGMVKGGGDGDASLLQPIKALLKGASSGQQQPSTGSKSSGGLYDNLPGATSSHPSNNKGSKVKYRDVFASTLGSVVERRADDILQSAAERGAAFGLGGEYDLYGGYELAESDDDADGAAAGGLKRKRPRGDAGGGGASKR